MSAPADKTQGAGAGSPVRGEPVLTVSELTAGYGPLEILHGVGLHVCRGETVSIIGPNGAGKSTVLKTVFGLVRATRGEIHVGGVAVQSASPASRLARGLGIVLQGRSNFPSMTVRENLEMGGFTLPTSRVHAQVDAMFERFPILATKRADAASSLSGGQQQVLEMAMAMMLEPKVLLIDEPSLGLDPRNSQLVFDFLGELRAHGMAILLVEQNAAQALRRSDWAYVLDQGANRLDGPAAQVLDDPEVRSLYLGGDEGVEDVT